MGTIKAALQAEDEQFISLHLLLEFLQVAEDGCTLEEVAKYLFREIIRAKEDAPPFLIAPDAHGTWLASKNDSLELLRWAADTGRYKEKKNSQEINVHYFMYGFDRTEIQNFLEERGVSIDFFDLSEEDAIPENSNRQAINTPSTDTELLGKYQDAEREKARLQQENDQLKEQLKRHAEQKNALLEKTEQIGKLQAENDRLNAELGSGKGKNTLLKMIAGMAISGHGINIHSERIEGISELADDLAEAGAPLDPKTISDRLKEAAQLIPRPKK